MGERDQALAAEPGQGRSAPGALPVLLIVAFHLVHYAFRVLAEPLENVVALAFAPAHPGSLMIDGLGALAVIARLPLYCGFGHCNRGITGLSSQSMPSA
ncbi:MAG TPA: hypothetical protein DCY13_12630 [Verrucomicrobiales bacterium]|nr:hypothetical protein [Verrucomicrobiales bacterium]